MPKEFETIKTVVTSNIWFKILTITAIALIVASWFVPPMAVIDGSVLAATGELIGFGALWIIVKALDKGTPASIHHNGTTITVNKDKDEAIRTEDQYQEEEER